MYILLFLMTIILVYVVTFSKDFDDENATKVMIAMALLIILYILYMCMVSA